MKKACLFTVFAAVLSLIACEKEDLDLSSGSCVINGENYTYQSQMISRVMGPYTYEARLHKYEDRFIFRALQMSFAPVKGEPDGPYFLIAFGISDTLNLVVGETYDIMEFEESGKEYTDCSIRRYRWADGAAYVNEYRYATGSVELTRIERIKDDLGWVEGIFEFEVPSDSEHEAWTAKGKFKIYTQIKL